VGRLVGLPALAAAERRDVWRLRDAGGVSEAAAGDVDDDDTIGGPVARSAPGNHTPIRWDLG
jgi:hypothetical protein